MVDYDFAFFILDVVKNTIFNKNDGSGYRVWLYSL